MASGPGRFGKIDFQGLRYPFDHRGKTMTMIPSRHLLHPACAKPRRPGGIAFEFPGARFVSHAVHITLSLPVRWGCCNNTPAPSCQIKRQLVFFRAAPVFGPLLSCGVRPRKTETRRGSRIIEEQRKTSKEHQEVSLRHVPTWAEIPRNFHCVRSSLQRRGRCRQSSCPLLLIVRKWAAPAPRQ
jgi:hypothetical protein